MGFARCGWLSSACILTLAAPQVSRKRRRNTILPARELDRSNHTEGIWIGTKKPPKGGTVAVADQ
jgi:hypothetical protein